ncbi:hypothetical protein HER10_EVM0012239 [Colletotrichum scovillei]|uniref:uncharacterized protein n=1 Tax=Colletotrichum scovillei TaxID=1209932 RepID=UPI0015C3BA93|nr:uncharacterized protein HER10_EVM0012239 [Colletotrichum scovillei]KAF4774376.1 hypothetical protein HER10_EVM0012239 [Colletotrichum scovillei]
MRHNEAASWWVPQPPTISLYELPSVGTFDGLHSVVITWELPLFRIVKSETITTDFIVQKLEEFQDEYGDVFCPHLDRNGITSQLLRALDPGHCGCPGRGSRIGRLIACDEARWGTRDCRRAVVRESGAELLPYSENRVRSRVCPSWYRWERVGRRIFLSRSSEDCIRKTDQEFWSSPLATLLDPESCSPESDHETKHLFWCEDANCRDGKDWIAYSKAF